MKKKFADLIVGEIGETNEEIRKEVNKKTY